MDDSNFRAMADEIEGLLGIDPDRHSGLGFGTRAVHGYGALANGTGSINQPIYQAATFAHPGLHRSTGFAYSRCGNPTVLELEDTIAMLEGGCKALAFCSGMAAISCVIKQFTAGDVVFVSDDLYGGTHRLFQDVYATRYGIADTSSAPAAKASSASTSPPSAPISLAHSTNSSPGPGRLTSQAKRPAPDSC